MRPSNTEKGKIGFWKEESIGIISFNNTDQNIIDEEVLQNLITILSVSLSEGDLKSIVITGSGDRSFSFGYDGSCQKLKEREYLKNVYSMGVSISRIFSSLAVPVISAVNGYALGLGLEIALSSDIILSKNKAMFGFPDIKFGLPSLTGIIPEIRYSYGIRAYNIILSGTIFSATEAKNLGIVTELLPDETFYDDVKKYISSLNIDLISPYKNETAKPTDTYRTDKLLFDFYDLQKIKIRELEMFRNGL